MLIGGGGEGVEGSGSRSSRAYKFTNRLISLNECDTYRIGTHWVFQLRLFNSFF